MPDTSVNRMPHDIPLFGRHSTSQFRLAVNADMPTLIECDLYAQAHPERQAWLECATSKGCVITASVDDAMVGFAVLEYTFFSNGFIPLVAVAPIARRSHHGLGLIAAAEQRCKTSKLFISTNRSNQAAQALFLRAGFVPSGQVENLDAPGDLELVYFKAVSPAK